MGRIHLLGPIRPERSCNPRSVPLFRKRGAVLVAGVEGVPVAIRREAFGNDPIGPGAGGLAAVLHGGRVVVLIGPRKGAVRLCVRWDLDVGEGKGQIVLYQAAAGNAGEVLRTPHPLGPYLPLEHTGEGRYTGNTTVAPLRDAHYDLPLVVQTADGVRYRFFLVTLDVDPAN